MSQESVKFGFFDGQYTSGAYDRLYDAGQISELFDGVIMDGVYLNWKDGTMKVTKAAGPRAIWVDPGKIWYKGTWTISSTKILIDIGELYDSSRTYAKDDFCVYESEFYKCLVDISVAEEWDSDHWEKITYTSGSETLVDFAIVLEVNKTDEVRENSIRAILKDNIVHTDDIDDYVIAYVSVAVNADYEDGFIYEHNIEYVVGTDESPYFAWILQDLSVEDVVKKWSDILGRTTIEFVSWFDVMQRLLDPDYESDRFSCMYPIALEVYYNAYVDNMLPRVNEVTQTDYGDGTTRTFNIRVSATSISNVRVNGERKPYSILKENPMSFTFLDAPAEGSIIVSRVVPFRANYQLYFEEEV